MIGLAGNGRRCGPEKVVRRRSSISEHSGAGLFTIHRNPDGPATSLAGACMTNLVPVFGRLGPV